MFTVSTNLFNSKHFSPFEKTTLRLSWWPNTVFLYLSVVHRCFQTTGSRAAKIGKIQDIVQLNKIIF